MAGYIRTDRHWRQSGRQVVIIQMKVAVQSRNTATATIMFPRFIRMAIPPIRLRSAGLPGPELCLPIAGVAISAGKSAISERRRLAMQAGQHEQKNRYQQARGPGRRAQLLPRGLSPHEWHYGPAVSVSIRSRIAHVTPPCSIAGKF